VPAGATRGRGQFSHLDERGALDALEHQLRDSLAPGQLQRLGRIMIDHDKHDLAPVPSVNGAGCVYQPEPRSRS